MSARAAAPLPIPATSPAQAEENRKLAIRIGADAFLIDVLGAGEIVAVPTVTPVPWTQPWFRGLTNVRGRLIGVIDLRHLGGGAPLPLDQAGQLVVLNPGLRYNVGLLATRAFGLRGRNDLTGREDLHDDARPWEIAAWRSADGMRLIEIDLQRLMDWDAFINIGI